MQTTFSLFTTASLCSALTLLGCAGSEDATFQDVAGVEGDGGLPMNVGGAANGGPSPSPSTGGGLTGTGGLAPTTGGAGPGTGGSATPGTGGVPSTNTGGTGGWQDTGTGGSGAQPMGGAPAGGSGPGETNGLPPCVDQSSQVAIIGDSYITGALTPALQPDLDALLVAGGAVSGYPNHAIAGAAMGSGGITGLIPPQFNTALAFSSDIRLVIMDGGGNDVLIPALGSPDCKNMVGSSNDPGCQAIVQTAVDAAAALITTMADAGVQDVVYFFYPHIPPTPGGLGGSNPNEILDYAYPFGAESCDSAWEVSGHRLRCHWIDLRVPFEQAGGYSNIASDGVHPAASGQKIIAGEIWRVMQENCLGQPSSSGCCAP